MTIATLIKKSYPGFYENVYPIYHNWVSLFKIRWENLSPESWNPTVRYFFADGSAIDLVNSNGGENYPAWVEVV